jgi:hypothetical protein
VPGINLEIGHARETIIGTRDTATLVRDTVDRARYTHSPVSPEALGTISFPGHSGPGEIKPSKVVTILNAQSPHSTQEARKCEPLPR